MLIHNPWKNWLSSTLVLSTLNLESKTIISMAIIVRQCTSVDLLDSRDNVRLLVGNSLRWSLLNRGWHKLNYKTFWRKKIGFIRFFYLCTLSMYQSTSKIAIVKSTLWKTLHIDVPTLARLQKPLQLLLKNSLLFALFVRTMCVHILPNRIMNWLEKICQIFFNLNKIYLPKCNCNECK